MRPAAWIALALASLSGPARAEGLAVPQGFRVEAFGQLIQEPFAQKMTAIQKNFRVVETSPGTEIQFMGHPRMVSSRLRGSLPPERSPGSIDDAPVITSRFVQQVSSDRSEREDKLVLASGGQPLYERETATRGAGLSPLDRRAALLLETPPASLPGQQLTLALNETYKSVSLKLLGQEAARLVSVRSVTSGSTPGTEVRTELWFGGARMLVFREARSSDGTRCVYTIERAAGSFLISVKGEGWGYGSSDGTRFRLTLARPPGFAIEQSHYEQDDREVTGMEDLSQRFSAEIWSPLMLGLSRALERYVDAFFPMTETRASIGGSDPFLLDFLQIRQQLQQAQSNPTMLQQAQGRIQLYILGIQNGTITITGQAPGRAP